MEQINAIELSHVLYILLDRILTIPSGMVGPLFMMDEDEEKSFYDRIIVNSAIVKPSESRLNEELEEYKQELRDIEQERLNEIARISDIESRFSAIYDIRGTFSALGIDIPNPASELKRIIAENDQSKLSELENKGIEVEEKITKFNIREHKKTIGHKRRSVCKSVLDLIAGNNDELGRSEEEIDGMEAAFAPIQASLLAGRSGKAKRQILEVQNASYDALKAEIIAEYEEHGL